MTRQLLVLGCSLVRPPAYALMKFRHAIQQPAGREGPSSFSRLHSPLEPAVKSMPGGWDRQSPPSAALLVSVVSVRQPRG